MCFLSRIFCCRFSSIEDIAFPRLFLVGWAASSDPYMQQHSLDISPHGSEEQRHGDGRADGRTGGRLSSPDRLTDDAHASIHLPPLSLSLPLVDVQGSSLHIL